MKPETDFWEFDHSIDNLINQAQKVTHLILPLGHLKCTIVSLLDRELRQLLLHVA